MSDIRSVSTISGNSAEIMLGVSSLPGRKSGSTQCVTCERTIVLGASSKNKLKGLTLTCNDCVKKEKLGLKKRGSEWVSEALELSKEQTEDEAVPLGNPRVKANYFIAQVLDEKKAKEEAAFKADVNGAALIEEEKKEKEKQGRKKEKQKQGRK